VSPDYGTLADFDALLDEAHARGMRVVLDLVLNHTSDRHAWFEASRTDPGGPFGDFYVWSDTPSHPDVGCDVHQEMFGDSPWAFDDVRQQYYFHRFYPQQPDLNYRNEAVIDATLDAARFWLDRGVDGFRCDVIALLYESATQCELLDETKAYIRRLREVVDEHPGAVLVAEPTDLKRRLPITATAETCSTWSSTSPTATSGASTSGAATPRTSARASRPSRRIPTGRRKRW
jgi:maltose alpha-D-glucosyltransferase/alpha-amylase